MAALAAVASAASAQVLLSTDFNSGLPAQFSGYGFTTPVQGYAGVGHLGNQFGGDLLYNDASGDPAASSTFTFLGLGAHTSISIEFLLAAIDSWDSLNGSPAPDYFNVEVDGTNVFQTSFANASGSFTYAGDDIGSGLVHRGFWNSYADRAFDMGSESLLQNIAHTSSSLTVRFFASGAGWQGGQNGIDEAFGIDNLTIRANPVPEPGTMSLLIGLGIFGRRFVERKTA